MTDELRVLVCGGRDYGWENRRLRIPNPEQRAFLAKKLDLLLEVVCEQGVTLVIIHGAAAGADTLAREWAESRGVLDDPFPADWDKYGKSAGHIRNKRMLIEGDPHLVIAFPGGRGTADMCELADSAGVPVRRYTQ